MASRLEETAELYRDRAQALRQRASRAEYPLERSRLEESARRFDRLAEDLQHGNDRAGQMRAAPRRE